MTAYVHILPVETTKALNAWPPTSLPFRRVADMPFAQKALWDSTENVPLEKWVQPFEQNNDDVALTILIDQTTSKAFACAAGFIEESPSNGEIIQHAKIKTGYFVRSFYADRQRSDLHAARIDSNKARERNFIAKCMQAFNQIDVQHHKTQRVAISAIGAGVYAWASYGAVPCFPSEFKRATKSQLFLLSNAARKRDLKLSPQLDEWVHGYYDEASFRRGFDANQDPLMKQSMKALMLGDLNFLRDAKHRYTTYSPTNEWYADSLNATLEIHPRDAGFQRHFNGRIAALIAKQP